MESDIETCYEESTVNPSEEINLDLITRYYQMLMSQVDNAAGKTSLDSFIQLCQINLKFLLA